MYDEIEVAVSRGDKVNGALVNVTLRALAKLPPQADHAYAQAAYDDTFNQLQRIAKAKLAELASEMRGDQAAVAQANLAPAPAGQPPRAPFPTEAPPAPTYPPIQAAPQAPLPQAPQAPVAPPAPVATNDGWAIGNKPQNRGTFRFRTTAVFPSEALINTVKAGIAQQGYDPNEFLVFDERSSGGQYPGLEQGGTAYGPASVKAKSDGRYAGLGKSQAFYADFDDDGTIKVTATKRLREVA